MLLLQPSACEGGRLFGIMTKNMYLCPKPISIIMAHTEAEIKNAIKVVRGELGQKKGRDELMFREMLIGKDVSEVVNVMLGIGVRNAYSRRILRFFRWFSRWIPIALMLTHWWGLYEFSVSHRPTFVLTRGSLLCDGWAYFMMYILPMVIIIASRFFFLCWKYRIPFLYFFGVNAVHLCYWSAVTTKDMLMAHYVVASMTALLYTYAIADEVMKNRCGRSIV